MRDDRKTRYTRRVMKESLFKLLKTKPLHKITVTAICRNADINRTTFYNHYADIYDMVESLEDELIQIIFHNVQTYNLENQTLLEYLTSLLYILKKHHSLLTMVMLDLNHSTFMKKLTDQLQQTIAYNIQYTYPSINRSDMNYIIAYQIHGSAYLIQLWIQNDMKDSPEYMAKLLMNTSNMLDYQL